MSNLDFVGSVSQTLLKGVEFQTSKVPEPEGGGVRLVAKIPTPGQLTPQVLSLPPGYKIMVSADPRGAVVLETVAP